MEQALGVASRMRAECTVLTHFSQRYPHAVEAPAAEEGDGAAAAGELPG
jgi:ribonuclease BN (tRNA processing enzyme)